MATSSTRRPARGAPKSPARPGATQARSPAPSRGPAAEPPGRPSAAPRSQARVAAVKAAGGPPPSLPTPDGTDSTAAWHDALHRALVDWQDAAERLLGPQAPSPMEPSAVDGLICGALLQPKRPAVARLLPWVLDVDHPTEGVPAGRAPAWSHVGLRAATDGVLGLVEQRSRRVAAALDARQWFDPCVPAPETDAVAPREGMLPWVLGFACAMEAFPAVMDLPDELTLEPLAVLYSAFEPGDLEGADSLLLAIEDLEPAETWDEMVEDIVSSLLLLADVTHPQGGKRPADARRG